jgi:hypothetical protein
MKTCRYFKKQLTAYMHGELAANKVRLLELHLDECVGCRAACDAQRSALSMLNEAFEAVPTAEELSPWRALKRSAYRPRNRWEQLWYSPQFKGVVAAGVLASLFILISGGVVVFRVFPKKPESMAISVAPANPGVDREDIHMAVNKRTVPRKKPVPRSPAVMLSQRRGMDDAARSLATRSDGLNGATQTAFDGFSVEGAQYERQKTLPRGRINAEQYGQLSENAFAMAMDQPLSTFAMEVDRGAYANVRRFLEANQLPPPDAIRIEEMINYFAYDYPEPKGEDPVFIALEVADCPWNEDHQLALVGLQGVKVAPRDLPQNDRVSEMGGALLTIAEEVQIQVEFNPAQVKAYRLIGYESQGLAGVDAQADGSEAEALKAGHAVTALYELIPEAMKYQRSTEVDHRDLMTVKLRYKRPGSDESRWLVRSVSPLESKGRMPSESFRLASEVAEFGLLLRDSEFKGKSSYEHVIRRAEMPSGEHENLRAEFIRLVEKARLLDRNYDD